MNNRIGSLYISDEDDEGQDSFIIVDDSNDNNYTVYMISEGIFISYYKKSLDFHISQNYLRLAVY